MEVRKLFISVNAGNSVSCQHTILLKDFGNIIA